MNDPLRLGLIGFGSVARAVHLPNIRSLSHVELVAISESGSAGQAAAAQLAPRARLLPNYENLLRESAIEAVIICLPTGLHAQASIAAFEAGKHVYLEKPLADQVADGQRVLAAWQKATTVGMIGFNYRFNRLYQYLRDNILRTNRLGIVSDGRTVFTRASPATGWKQQRHSGGGILLDLASHHIDLVRFLFGQEVERVQAWSQSRHAEDDIALLTLELSGGVCVQSSFAAGVYGEDCLELYGSRANAQLDRINQRLTLVEPHEFQTPARRILQRLQSVFFTPYLVDGFVAPHREPSYRAALSHFIECVRLGRQPSPDVMDGYRSLAVLAAAEESARQGRPVEVCEIDGTVTEASR